MFVMLSWFEHLEEFVDMLIHIAVEKVLIVKVCDPHKNGCHTLNSWWLSEVINNQKFHFT